MDKKQRHLVIAMALLTIFLVSSTTLFTTTSVSGYQSMTANWYKVYWPNVQGLSETFELDLRSEESPKPSTFTYDADNILPFLDGWTDLNTYTGEIENPKFDENINYHDWWVNDTITTSNPDGFAQHFEWSIDIYTMNVNFYATAGVWYAEGLQIWAEIENNYNSVFEILGAEDAVSYVLYAETGSYNWTPEDAGWHLIVPAVGNFELMFLDGTEAVPPAIPEEGSDVNFGALEPYSHVAIAFEFIKFGKAQYGSDCTVNMIVNLNILTIGRFDYVLTYVEAGENEIGPVGQLGLYAGIAGALDAGFGALMDGFSSLAESMFGPLISIAVIGVCVAVIIIILKRGSGDK